jgi:hypothetical protein
MNAVMDPKIAGVLDDALHLAETAVEENQSLQTKIAELQQKLSLQDKVILQKVATAPVFSEDALEKTLAYLERISLIDAAAHTKLSTQLRDEPDLALALITRVAEAVMAPPADGHGIDKEASAEPETDPDGWTDWIKGRPVRLRK